MTKSLCTTFKNRKVAFLTTMSLMLVMMASSAFAFTPPANGDMFYEVYDLVINNVMSGPIGFVIGAIMLIGGIFLLVQGKGFLLPLICLVGGVILVKVESIVTSFGFSMDAVVNTANATIESVGQFLM